jgi:superoxide dismutase, Fe-Mn family
MKHVLPPLPYDAAALEPHIDARTMLVHHGQHHAGYVESLRRALQKAPPALQLESAGWLLRDPQRIPDEIRSAVLDNAGGHVNHGLLWRSMTPGGGAPSGALADAIDRAFGSIRKLRARFEEAGATVFGSGWVWLVQPPGGFGPLRLMTTSGYGNPVTQGCVPILVNDVWEHAYYLKHENRRADYLKRWWAVVDWSEASRRYARACAAAAEGAGVISAARAGRPLPEHRPASAR